MVSLTRNVFLHNEANIQLSTLGVDIIGYDPEASVQSLAEKLKGLDVLISCMSWEQLESQIPWIQAAKMAGVKRFVPSEWVSPAPRGVIDIKDKVCAFDLELHLVSIACLICVVETRHPWCHTPRRPSVYAH